MLTQLHCPWCLSQSVRGVRSEMFSWLAPPGCELLGDLEVKFIRRADLVRTEISRPDRTKVAEFSHHCPI